MHNIYYLWLSGEQSLPFGLLVWNGFLLFHNSFTYMYYVCTNMKRVKSLGIKRKQKVYYFKFLLKDISDEKQ